MSSAHRALLAGLVGLAGLAAGYLAYHLMQPRPALQVSGVPALDPATGADPPAPAPAKPIPGEIPALELPDLEGSRHSLREYVGRPLILNFWATWCAPCRREIPLLTALLGQYGAEGLQVVGIAVDFRAAVQDYVHRTPIRYPLLIGEQDGLAAVSQFGMEAVLPFSVFADRRGRILALKAGELHPQEARAILGAMADEDGGRITLAAARERIRSELETLAVDRAKAQQLSP